MIGRHWQRRLVAVGVLALLGALGACAGEEATPTPTQPPTTASPTPTQVAPSVNIGQYGGVMNWAVKAEFRYADITRAGSVTEHTFFGPAFSQLLRYDPLDDESGLKKQIISDLATSWEVQDGGLTYVFHLRDDAFWHDGTPVTADDVLASWQRGLTQGSARASYGHVFESSEAPDSRTAIMHLHTPLASFIDWMAYGGGASKIMQKRQMIEELGGIETRDDPLKSASGVVGSGPFRIVSADVSTGVEAERVDNYYLFDTEGNRLPYLGGYHAFGITDRGTRNAALLGGALDAVQSVTFEPAQAKEVTAQESRIRVLVVGNADWYSMVRKAPPFDDYRVRKAVFLAYDRWGNRDVIEQDTKYGNVYGLTPPVLGGFPTEELWQMPGYRQDKTEDIAEANRLLDAAGYARGPDGYRFTIEVFSPATETYVDNGIIYANDLKENLDINFTTDPAPDNATEGTRSSACDYTYFARRSSSDVDANAELGVIIIDEGDSAWECGWRTPQYIRDAYLDQSATLDPASRAQKIQQLELAYYEDQEFGYFWIPKHWSTYLIGVWDYVKGGGWDKDWFMRFEHVGVQNVWLDR